MAQGGERKPVTLGERFPVGTRVVADRIDSIRPPPKGAAGTVVDATNPVAIVVLWDQYGIGAVISTDKIHKEKEPRRKE